MLIAIATVLMVIGPLLTLALAVVIPVTFGAMAYEIGRRTDGSGSAERTQGEPPAWRKKADVAEVRIQVERGVARAFVMAGGAFWMLTALAAYDWFGGTGAGGAFLAALVPLFAAAATLVVGWYWERVASVLLAIAGLGAVSWGMVSGFELGVWVLFTFTLIGPMLTAAALFWLARSEQDALALLRMRHEPALATAGRPS